MSRFAGLMLVTLVACGGDDGHREDMQWPDAQVIRSLRMQQNAAIADHDLDRIVEYWTDDVMITASSGEVRLGQDQYRAALQRAFERFDEVRYVRTPRRIVRSSVPGLALEEGTWVGTWLDEGVEVMVGGSYLAQWRRDNNEWRIRSELFVATEDFER